MVSISMHMHSYIFNLLAFTNWLPSVLGAKFQASSYHMHIFSKKKFDQIFFNFTCLDSGPKNRTITYFY